MATLKDRVIIGAIAGAAALLTRDVYNIIAKAIGLAKFYVWQLGASLFLQEKIDIQGIGGAIVGIPADMIMGALIGVVFVYFLKWTEDKNPILKGWGTGLAAWLLLYGFFWHNLPTVQQKGAPGDVLSNLSALLGHSVFGLALGIYAWYLMKWQGLVQTGKSGKGGKGDGEVDDDADDKHGVAAPKAPSVP